MINFLNVSNVFWSCSIVLVIILCFLCVGGEVFWLNGIYDVLVVIILFLLIIYWGVKGEVKIVFMD